MRICALRQQGPGWHGLALIALVGAGCAATRQQGDGDPGGGASGAGAPTQRRAGPAAASTTEPPDPDPVVTPTPVAEPPGPSRLPPQVDWSALPIANPRMYSAFDGVHTFTLPAYVPGLPTTPRDWRAIPSDAVTFGPFRDVDSGEQGVLLTIVRPVEEITVVVQSGPLGGQAKLFVTLATPAQWEVGHRRYTEGVAFDVEAFGRDPRLSTEYPELIEALQTDANGAATFSGPVASLGLTSDFRCDGCHTVPAQRFPIVHTPVQLSGWSDDALRSLFESGRDPSGRELRMLPGVLAGALEVAHRWSISRAQADGLIVYLRSLIPRGSPLTLPGERTDEVDGVPEACDPQSDVFDLDLCQSLLPASCDRESPMFDLPSCAAALGIMLPEGFESSF